LIKISTQKKLLISNDKDKNNFKNKKKIKKLFTFAEILTIYQMALTHFENIIQCNTHKF